jgi:hypothetical protein
MKIIGIAALSLVLASSFGAAGADPWKDESGHGRGRGEWSRHWDRARHWDRDRYEARERKVEYDDGRCKVERKWGKGGEYKEERKCRGGLGRGLGNHEHPGYGSGYPPYSYGGSLPYGYHYR